MEAMRFGLMRVAGPLAAALTLLGISAVHASGTTPSTGNAAAVSAGASRFALIASEEARRAGVPVDLVDAVINVESGYDPARIGAVGEIGLMQVRPATAAMLGFRGTTEDLADPAVNIHYGTAYLGQAWALTHGDLCRTLMKYRAGHGEEAMSQLSATYCSRALAHLASVASPLAVGVVVPAAVGATSSFPRGLSTREPVDARSPRHGDAFWRAEEARVRAITARLHARWRLADRR